MENHEKHSSLPSEQHALWDTLTHAERIETVSVRFAILAAAIAASVTFLMTFGMRDVWVVGEDNLLSRLILFAALAIAVSVTPYAYMSGAIWRNSKLPANRQTKWRNRIVPVTVGALFTNFLLVLVAMVLIDRAFPNLAMSRWAAMITMGFAAAAITYLTGHFYYHLRAPAMLMVSLASLFGTLLFAGAMHENAQWFVESFSHLGATDTNMRYLFNVGIIATGILIVVWQQFLMDDLSVLEEKGLVTTQALRYIRHALILTAILLSLVGATPWGINTTINVLHMLVAGGSGAVAGVLVLTIWWLLPWFPRWFYYAGWLMVAVTAVVVALKLADYVWLTGMQFAGFTVMACWLTLFQRSCENLLQRVDPETKALAAREYSVQDFGAA